MFLCNYKFPNLLPLIFPNLYNKDTAIPCPCKTSITNSFNHLTQQLILIFRCVILHNILCRAMIFTCSSPTQLININSHQICHNFLQSSYHLRRPFPINLIGCILRRVIVRIAIGSSICHHQPWITMLPKRPLI